MQKGVSRAGDQIFAIFSISFPFKSFSPPHPPTYCFHPRFPIHRRFKGGAARIQCPCNRRSKYCDKDFCRKLRTSIFFFAANRHCRNRNAMQRDGNPGRFVKKECKKNRRTHTHRERHPFLSMEEWVEAGGGRWAERGKSRAAKPFPPPPPPPPPLQPCLLRSRPPPPSLPTYPTA